MRKDIKQVRISLKTVIQERPEATIWTLRQISQELNKKVSHGSISVKQIPRLLLGLQGYWIFKRKAPQNTMFIFIKSPQHKTKVKKQ